MNTAARSRSSSVGMAFNSSMARARSFWIVAFVAA